MMRLVPTSFSELKSSVSEQWSTAHSHTWHSGQAGITGAGARIYITQDAGYKKCEIARRVDLRVSII